MFRDCAEAVRRHQSSPKTVCQLQDQPQSLELAESSTRHCLEQPHALPSTNTRELPSHQVIPERDVEIGGDHRPYHCLEIATFDVGQTSFLQQPTENLTRISQFQDLAWFKP